MVKSVIGGFEKIPKIKTKPFDNNLETISYRNGKKKKKSWDRSSRTNKYGEDNE